jgi:hypothetical protein
MRSRRRLAAIGAVTAVAAWCALGGSALAAFPNFSDCPSAGLPSGSVCVDIQSQSGEIEIKGFHVPLDHSLELRGALRSPEGSFVPPAGTDGFFAEPVNVPGGLLGLELPLSLNQVLATAELAGPSSSISIKPGEFKISLPIKLRLSNPLIGSNCHIGSNSHPVRLNLRIGTTEPPPPNMPISGHAGTLSFVPPDTAIFSGILDVENSFSIPGATDCGGFGLIDLLIDAKLKLPSAEGNNAIQIENDAALKLLP